MVRKTKEEARETRNRILDAAEQVFYDKGVSRTSLADIAAQAGVTRGAIYWHFANKGDLFTAMFDRVLLPLDELSAAMGESTDPLARLAEKLKWCLRAVAVDPLHQPAAAGREIVHDLRLVQPEPVEIDDVHIGAQPRL